MRPPKLAFCGDRHVVLSMAVTVRSIARHASEPVEYIFLTPDFDAPQKKKISQCVNSVDRVRFITPKRTFSHLHKGLNNSEAYYYRLGLPDALPEESKILYLDSDLLVRDDIVKLWRAVETSKAPAQACREYGGVIKPGNLPMYAEYGHTLGGPYYNSGILGMDLDQWRNEGLADQMISFLQRHGDSCPGWDQGAINALLGLRIDPLDQEWNIFAPVANESAKVAHFSTWRKPFVKPRSLFKKSDRDLAAWQRAMKDKPIYQEYFAVLDETPYRGWRPSSVVTALMSLVPTRLLQAARDARFKQGGV